MNHLLIIIIGFKIFHRVPRAVSIQFSCPTWHTHHVLQLGGLEAPRKSDKWKEESNIVSTVVWLQSKCYYLLLPHGSSSRRSIWGQRAAKHVPCATAARYEPKLRWMSESRCCYCLTVRCYLLYTNKLTHPWQLPKILRIPDKHSV